MKSFASFILAFTLATLLIVQVKPLEKIGCSKQLKPQSLASLWLFSHVTAVAFVL